jgi:phosphoribosylamine--glycine ligase
VARGRVVRGPDEVDAPGVVKLDGLAAGKGVWVCDDLASTRAAVAAAAAARPGASILLEERLVGPEVSVLALCDGLRAAPLPAARDHKRRFDEDQGPNTGGMGAVCPVALTEVDRAICHDTLARAVAGMGADGTPFRGVLYGGFMLTDAGPRLLEFNVRFGDPECQAVLALLDEDLAPWLMGAALGALPPGAPRFVDGASCCVVVAADAYPESSANARIEALPADAPDLVTYQAGTALGW